MRLQLLGRLVVTCTILLILLGALGECRFLYERLNTQGYDIGSSNGDNRDYGNGQSRQAISGDKCGYKSCPKTDPKRLNVHIIAHTHDDVGWLKTVDQYYYGTKKRFSQAGVQYILDSVVPQLLMDSSKRFIYVEMSFFSKWWNEQEESMRETVKSLVNDGRLEFINGGWCMNDEATVTYHSTIEQMTLGLKFLNETFGACGRPKVGWQIDPFGHTNEQASLFAQFGFDGMFFTRISFEDKAQRVQNKSLDLIWHGDRALQGQSGSIFTNIFRDGYDAPNGYCFDSLCFDDAIVDNPKSYEYNIQNKGRYMIQFIRDYAKAKLTNHVLIPFGGDFQFSAAGQNFKSIDKLIKYIRQHAPDMNIFYSTPSCYQYAIHQAIESSGVKLPEKYNDFMPYDSSPTVWWSGYFASRPSVKLVEREVADLLQVARMLSLSDMLDASSSIQAKGWSEALRSHGSKCLNNLWEILGDLQHHDAITGTEKQHVADDYVRRASDARRSCSKFIGDMRREKLNRLLQTSPEYDTLRVSGEKFHLDPVFLEDTMFCPMLNISQCDALEADVNIGRYMNVTTDKTHDSTGTTHSSGHATFSHKVSLPKELETKGVLVTAYNPLARAVQQLDFRLPCIGRCDLEKIQVIHVGTNETLKLLRLPVPAGIANLPFRDAVTNYEILFYANIPPLGSSSFVVSDENSDDIVDEESYPDDAILITDDTSKHHQNVIRSRRIHRSASDATERERYQYFSILDLDDEINKSSEIPPSHRRERLKKREADGSSGSHSASDRVIVKFDMHSGVIVGLKRVSDGSSINITQRFGYYFPANMGHSPGAYIFRPNSTEPTMMDKPTSFKMYKRQNGALIEIHQKWANWAWQTIRVDSKKNYIEFDYVIGPIPAGSRGREIVTRYQTNMANEGVFFTDSGARQMMPRHRFKSELSGQLGGSFYPVVSTIMIKNNKPTRSTKSADAVSILVDRAQAGTSLKEGDIELLIHRRQLNDDNFGVAEALNEPGEDGRGLVTRGKHRLFLKFQDQTNMNSRVRQLGIDGGTHRRPSLFALPKTPRENLTHEFNHAHRDESHPAYHRAQGDDKVYIVNDPLLNDIRQEAIKYALKPILTFDRLRVSASDFMRMLSNANQNTPSPYVDTSLLNTTMPSNIHLLTLQPWDGGQQQQQLLVRFENLDNPLTLHPSLNLNTYNSSLHAYKSIPDNQIIEVDPTDPCFFENQQRSQVDVEYLIKDIRITSLDELNLGANNRLKDEKRLDWTKEQNSRNCDLSEVWSTITLRPRQIRTFLASYEQIS